MTRLLPAARDGHAESIRQARVATRRLREALPLLAPGPRGRALGKTVRRLTRALGPVRELDVALITLIATCGDAEHAAERQRGAASAA